MSATETCVRHSISCVYHRACVRHSLSCVKHSPRLCLTQNCVSHSPRRVGTEFFKNQTKPKNKNSVPNPLVKDQGIFKPVPKGPVPWLFYQIPAAECVVRLSRRLRLRLYLTQLCDTALRLYQNTAPKVVSTQRLTRSLCQTQLCQHTGQTQLCQHSLGCAKTHSKACVRHSWLCRHSLSYV